MASAGRTSAGRSANHRKRSLPASGEEQPACFERVCKEELEEIAELSARRKKSVGDITSFDADRLVGLAFSGGGIRSATFNLGVLQALAKLKLLHRFDYLSTVSGGGYIGSWLVAWLQRACQQRQDGPKALEDVCRKLSPDRIASVGCTGASGTPEPPPVRFLRKYSNYLTPRMGFFSSDTWAMIATYLRNLLLNQLILVLALAGALALPRMLYWISLTDPEHLPALLVNAYLLLLLAVMVIGRNMIQFDSVPDTQNPSKTQKRVFLLLHFLPGMVALLLVLYGFTLVRPSRWWWVVSVLVVLALGVVEFLRVDRQFRSPAELKELLRAERKSIVIPIVLPLVVAAWLGFCWLWFTLDYPRPKSLLAGPGLVRSEWEWPMIGAISYAVPWLLGGIFGLLPEDKRDWRSWIRFFWTFTAAVAAGLVGGQLIAWFLAALIWWKLSLGGFWSGLFAGVPLMLLLFTGVAALHIGLMGLLLPEEKREWWARLGGILLKCAIVWMVLFGIALYGPLAPQWAKSTWARSGLTVGWIVTTLGGVLAGRSEKTRGGEGNRGMELIGRVAPYIFILGMLVLISWGLDFAVQRFAATSLQAPEFLLSTAPGGDQDDFTFPLASSAEGYWRKLEDFSQRRVVGWLMPVCLVLAYILSVCFDVNEFSMHLFYRNRLARCYLGASNDNRSPNPFTGFARDDILMADLLPSRGNTAYAGPYPIINTAVNLVQGEELAWQQRKSASFVFTPRYCGFALPSSEALGSGKLEGFRPTSSYMYRNGGPFLGTAMAVSGAAASPNMGYHTSVPLAFLMTLFNVRLGWWAGNPTHRWCWKNSGPWNGLSYLLTELAGAANVERGYVYLSDGGHFENLGIYELVRRRCRLILACDAAADPEVKFGDLGNAIEKCRTDFGVNIEIDTSTLKPPAGSRYSQWHCVVGRIHYGKGEVGTLIYLKSSLTGDEPSDVQAYAAENSDFPQQTTADQFFDESQFESYRALGYHAATSAFEFLGNADHIAGLQTEQIAIEMRQRWHPPSSATEEQFTKHTATLRHIFTTLRENSDLRFLDEQVYLEWPPMLDNDRRQPNLWLPIGRDSEPKLRAGFYLCNEMIQLMEDVYTDLKLETECDHPDNRGWMNLFKHWSWSGMFRVTWAICAGTYGARFQEFCRRRLDLETGEVQVGDPIPLPPPDAEEEEWKRPSIAKRFNFLEIELMRDSVAKMRGKCAACPLEIQVRDTDDKSKKRSFVYGFCIVRTGADEPGWEICYFRVQDHLRRMGLARKALRELLTQGKARGGTRLAELVSSQLPTAEGQKLSEEDRRRFEALFYSVTHEV